MKRRSYPYGTFKDPESVHYKKILPYLKAIARGEDYSVKQIMEATGYTYANILTVYSHFLKHMEYWKNNF